VCVFSLCWFIEIVQIARMAKKIHFSDEVLEKYEDINQDLVFDGDDGKVDLADAEEEKELDFS